MSHLVVSVVKNQEEAMLNSTFGYEVPRSSSLRVLLTGVIVSGFFACGSGDEALTLGEVGSISSALTYTVPSGYTKNKFFNADGVECYSQGSYYQDYVCAVNLKRARVRTVNAGKSGSDSFNLKTLPDLWNLAPGADSGKNKVLAVNISFFGYHYDADPNPREISFPYKQWRWNNTGADLLTKGTDCAGAGGKMKNLYIWWDRKAAAIGSMGCTTADFTTLESYGSAPDIIGGLDAKADKGWINYRTFIGVRDGDDGGSGWRETLLIYTGQWQTQDYAAQQLYDFGAQEVVMFDGSGSTQLIVNSSSKISSARRIPNALVVYAAP